MRSTLYKKNRNGKLQQWTIETEDNRYRTAEGYIDGLQTPTEWTSCQGKRIGSTNETSPQEQAIKEAEARVRKQLDKGWTEDINAVDEAAMKISPMLAHKFLDYIEVALSWKHIALQFKYDGVRCPGTKNGLFTRTGKPMVAVPHIQEAVESLLEGLDYDLDGELYNEELKDDFNAITSIVKKTKPTAEDIQKAKELMKYYVYDIDCKGLSFAARYAALQLLFTSDTPSCLILAPTIFLDNSDGHVTKELLQEYLSNFIELGYEGLMIRNADAEYQNHRTKDLLKWKEFQDEEFEVTDIVEGRGNRAGIAASVFCKDKRGEEFSAGIKGTVDYCRQLLIEKDQYIGKMCTVKFQNYTPDRQVPRFPKVIDFDRID